MPKGKLTFYSEQEFKIHNYWGSPNEYKTVLYFSFEFGRPVFDVFQDATQAADNTQVVNFEAITETISFDVLYNLPMLALLFAIPLHEKVELTNLDTAETFELVNLSITDTGGADPFAKQTISAQLANYSASAGCGNENYVKVSC